MDVVGECRGDAQQSCNCFLIECQSPLSILYDASCNQDEGGAIFPFLLRLRIVSCPVVVFLFVFHPLPKLAAMGISLEDNHITVAIRLVSSYCWKLYKNYKK